MHGYEIANSIQRISDDVLQVEEGSLYPALQRMLIKGWVTAKWSTTAGNRRARYYQLTTAGRKQLAAAMSPFARAIGAITRAIEAVSKELCHELDARRRETTADARTSAPSRCG